MNARQLIFVCTALCIGHVAMAQTLAPRAYVITPVNANAITLSWSYFDGGLNFNGAIPVTGATGTYHVPSSVTIIHSVFLGARQISWACCLMVWVLSRVQS